MEIKAKPVKAGDVSESPGLSLTDSLLASVGGETRRVSPDVLAGFPTGFPTIPLAAASTTLKDGATYRVNSGWNGEPEDFTYDAGSALTADGALIVNATGMGAGRLISTRTVYADWEEFDADPRNLEVGIELSVLNVGGYLTVSSGESFETSGGNKVKVKKLPWGWYSTVQFGAACDGATDDYAAMQAAVDAGKADKVKVFHPGLSYISQAVRVDKAWLEGGSSDSGIIVTGEYDGIILTGIHDGSSAGFDQRPAVRNMTIWSSGTQATANAGLRLGDDTNQLVLAGFLVEGVSFKRVNNSGRSAASALVCAEGASTGYAFIGAIRDISVHRWRHPFHGTKAVNNIIFDGWNQSGCSQSFRIGDARGVTITGFESGSNQYRAMDIGDCQGLTIIEPYLEDNFRDADLGGSKYDILISALAAQGFRRDHPFNSIRIIGGTFNKSATGSGNCVGAILWASSEGVVIDGASIGGYVESVRVNSLAVNKGVIKNLQKSPSVHAAVPDPIIGALADVQYWPASTPPKFMNERLTETNGTPGPISVAAGAQTSFAVSVSGLTKSDYLMSWRCGATLPPGLIVTAHTHTDEVRFSVFNPTGGTIAVSAATWTVLTGPSGIYA